LNFQYKAINIDYLTGAYNRRYLDTYIMKKIRLCNKSHHAFACILIDIDHFKQINDVYGHGTGDRILKITVDLLKKCLINKKGVVARYGGDEFYIVLHMGSAESLRSAVGEIKTTFNDYNSATDITHKIQYSIGYDIYSLMWGDCNSFQNHIDILMYEDKKAKPK